MIYIVVSSVHRIRNADRCVYARIVELCIGNVERLFEMSEAVTADKYGKCNYREEKNCDHRGNEDDCMCNAERVSLSFGHLEKQHIIKKVGERWMLMR